MVVTPLGLDHVYVAPVVADQVARQHTLRHAPRFLPGPDDQLAVYIKGDNGWSFNGWVDQVERVGMHAFVHVVGTQDQPTHDLYIVPVDALPVPPVPTHFVDHISIAADALSCQGAVMPERLRFDREADGAIGVYISRGDSWHFDGMVRQIHREPGTTIAIVEVVYLNNAAHLYIVRADRLPAEVQA